MFISYSYPAVLKAEKVNLSAGKSATAVDTRGLSAQVKIIDGSCFICGSGCNPTQNCYPLEKGDTLCFSGVLKILPGSSGVDARIIYFDSI